MMKRMLPILLDTLYALALALWFGLPVALFLLPRPAIPDGTLASFVERATGLIEVAGIVMVVVQFLLRRRYARNRQLLVADGIRQLLTFGALLLAEFGRHGLLKPGHTLTAQDITALSWLAGAQMVVLAAVTALTSWLQTRAMAPIPAASADSSSRQPVTTPAPAKPTLTKPSPESKPARSARRR
jgi:hypothetical protein